MTSPTEEETQYFSQRDDLVVREIYIEGVSHRHAIKIGPYLTRQGAELALDVWEQKVLAGHGSAN